MLLPCSDPGIDSALASWDFVVDGLLWWESAESGLSRFSGAF